MNEIVTRNANGEVSVPLPFNREVSVPIRDGFEAHIQNARDVANARRAAFDGLGDLAQAPIEAVKELRKQLEADDKTIQTYCTEASEAFAKLFRFDEFVMQTSAKKGAKYDPLSIRGKLREMIGALKAREDAEKVAEPTHTYVMQFEVTDADLKKVVAVVTKVTDKWRYAVPQGDKGMRQAEKFFEDNI